MIGDIPATIVDTLGLKNPFPGISAMKVDEHAARPRSFAVYPWSSSDWKADHFPYMDVFTINGPVIDGHGLEGRGPHLSHGTSTSAGARADSTRPSGAVRASRSDGAARFRILHAPPDAKSVELAVRSASPTPQTLTVEIRGKVVDTRKLTDNEWHTIRYEFGAKPKDAQPDAEWIVLKVDPIWRPRGDGRRLGVMTRDCEMVELTL